MPSLSYSAITDYPFQPFTKIYSADINLMFSTIATLLNTTGLDDTNIQDAGLSITKLKKGTGTAGQFVSNNGTLITWANNPLTAQFNVVMGSAAQVTAGTATHSTYASYSASAADGDRVLILPGYVTAESWTIAKKLYIVGLGNTSVITGGVTFATGSSKSYFNGVRVTTGITVNSGVDGVVVPIAWFPAGITFTDNATLLANSLTAMVET